MQPSKYEPPVQNTGRFRIPGFYFVVIGVLTVIIFELTSLTSGINYIITKYRWQSTYTKFTTSYYRACLDYRGIESNTSGFQVLRILINNLDVERLCENSVSEGCWPKESYFADGSPVYSYEQFRGFVLKNGVLVSGIQAATPTCDSKTLCNVISFDLNGHKKPNTFGKDQFRLYYYSDKLVPYFHGEDNLIGTTVKYYLNLK